MSSRPQVSPTTDYENSYDHNMFESNSRIDSRSQRAAAISCPSVLLVGRNASWGKSVLRRFQKFGCELALVTPQIVTSQYVRNGGHNLILLDSTVSSEQRRQLASELIGSEVSIFYTFPVENDCWWLPVLRRGGGLPRLPGISQE